MSPFQQVIHWRSHEARLLAPFYSFVLHTDEVAERYYKRLLRDLVHFPEEVYCKASQVKDDEENNPLVSSPRGTRGVRKPGW